ncbi:MAG: hypothetical protein ABI861_02585 [Panacibacter sp.]
MAIVFIAGQLFINYKRGVVCTPFFHYGMYSEVIKPTAQYNIPEVSVNGKRLAAKDFSPQQWDNIMQPGIKFYKQEEWNSKYWQTDIHRLLPFTDSSKFVNTITEDQFMIWYRQRLENITGNKIGVFNIEFADYTFKSGSFTRSNKQPF